MSLISIIDNSAAFRAKLGPDAWLDGLAPSLSRSDRHPTPTKQAPLQNFLERLGPSNTELSIDINPATDKIVIQILNSETREVIKQIPDAQLLRLAENLKAFSGAIFDEVA